MIGEVLAIAVGGFANGVQPGLPGPERGGGRDDPEAPSMPGTCRFGLCSGLAGARWRL